MTIELDKNRVDIAILHLFKDLNDRGGFDLSNVDEKTLLSWRKEWYLVFCERAVHVGGRLHYTDVRVKLLINDLFRDLNDRGGFNTLGVDQDTISSWKADWFKIIKERSL